ncbi:exported hypothetical protein [Candidatus Sulfopaludibacter sp. SbA4]|nr:exported hypothetical protein [Candidatus Sulfopaludibacter sp. SbA4]
MTRREILAAAGSASAWLALDTATAQTGVRPMPNMGGAPAGFPMHSRAARGGGPPFDFVDYCHRLGFGVVETRLASSAPEEVKKFRDRIETFHMRVIMDLPLPRAESDVPAFDAAVKAAKESGAISLHTAMTQRRYEQFDTGAAQVPHTAGNGEPQGLAVGRTGGLAEARVERVGGGASRFRQQRVAVRRSGGDAAEPAALRGGEPHQRHGSGAVRGWLPSLGGAAGRRLPGSEGDGRGVAEEGREHAVRPGDDHARSAQDSGVHGQVLGDVRRPVQPAAGARPGARAGDRAQEPAEDAAAAHDRHEP